MRTIEFEPYEVSDLLEILNYAEEEYTYRAKFDKSGLPDYWLRRIKQLRKILEGKRKNGFSIKASRLDDK